MRAYNIGHPDACVTSLTTPAAWQTGSADVILADFATKINPDDQLTVGQYVRLHLEQSATGLAPGVVQTFSSSRFRARSGDGPWVWYEIRSRLISHSSGVVLAEGLFTEVTELMDMLLADSLTGLRNRLATEQWLQSFLERSADRCMAVISLDVDNFRALNQCLGYKRGDAVICAVADLLREVTAEHHWLARDAADEFLIVIHRFADQPTPPTPDEIARHVFDLCRCVQQSLLERLSLPDCLRTRVTVCCGIALRSPDQLDARALLHQASSALSQAKQLGPGSVCLFSSALEEAQQQRLSLERDLEEALRGQGLSLEFQPKVDPQGHWIGAEVLVRWTRPDGSTVPPDLFIPVAEQTGQIHALSDWILSEACAQLGRWNRQGLRPPPLALNLSPVQLMSPLQGHPSLLESVQALCAEHGLQPDQLSFEITETALLHDVSRALEQLNPLVEGGITLAIDDFGTGYSSLTLLQTLPVNLIKVDQTFVKRLPTSAGDRSLVGGMLAIAHQLGMGTIAEGVETEEQRDCLEDLGCDAYQGYLFSRPLTAEAFGLALSNRLAPPLAS
ncbi:MAG: hypothetical protein RLZZ631_1627 [Cyanobacteriota bacterium]